VEKSYQSERKKNQVEAGRESRRRHSAADKTYTDWSGYQKGKRKVPKEEEETRDEVK